MKKIRKNPIGETLMMVNPSKRRRHRKVSFRRYRKNPASLNEAMDMIKPAFIGAGGALATNAATNYLGTSLIPPSLLTGPTLYATKAAIAIGLGMLANRFMNPAMAAKATEGALIVQATQFLQYIALTNMGLNLSGAGYLSPARVVSAPGMRGVGKYVSGTGKYLNGMGDGLANSRDYQQAGARIIPLR